ncbi:hypothetical protein J6590_074537 [Homalodisca vitripennis]|nr:hypothetical protein J6590_074537 [Homalodisca vitripennis]
MVGRYSEPKLAYSTPLGFILKQVSCMKRLTYSHVNMQNIGPTHDTTILFERGSWEEVYRVAAGELALVKRWFDENILTTNFSKTKCMLISLRSAGEPPVDMGLVLHSCGDTNTGSCDCRVLQRVNQYKYLGVIMDSKLKWEPHIPMLKSQIRKMIYEFHQLTEILNPSKNIYYTYA